MNRGGSKVTQLPFGARLGLVLLSLAVLATPAQAQVAAEGFWEGAAEREGRTWTLRVNLSSGQKAPAIVELPDFGVYDLPFAASIDGTELTLELRGDDGSFILPRGQHLGDRFEGTLTTNSLSPDVLEAGFALERVGPPRLLYREEEIGFSNSDVSLAGTLILPLARDPIPPSSGPTVQAIRAATRRSIEAAGTCSLATASRL